MPGAEVWLVEGAILDFFAEPPFKRCPHCEKLLADPVEPKLPKLRHAAVSSFMAGVAAGCVGRVWRKTKLYFFSGPNAVLARLRAPSS